MKLTAEYMRLLVLAIVGMCNAVAMGTDFDVALFRLLPNDVSAFITPVRDLNGDACALIKIEASPDFVFSTPLGIVRRIDKTGEIWLYIPHGSKKITLKHPEWGVLRDYRFPGRIEGQSTYEMRLSTPEPVTIAPGDYPVQLKQDTIVITRTDTLLVTLKPPRSPLNLGISLLAGFGGRARSFMTGVMLTAGRRHGAFLSVLTDFGRLASPAMQCDRMGFIDGRMPWYSGKTRHGFLSVNAGVTHRLSKSFGIFEGLGYAADITAWKLANSEGGAEVRNSYYSDRGLTATAGGIYRRGNFSFSLSVLTLKLKGWYGVAGIGYNFKAP